MENFQNPDKSFSRTVVKDLKLHSSNDKENNPHLQNPFTLCELNNALNSFKFGKALGPDGIHNEFLVHSGTKLKNWLPDFLNLSFSTKIIPKMWRHAKVVAILKPGKDSNIPQSYRPNIPPVLIIQTYGTNDIIQDLPNCWPVSPRRTSSKYLTSLWSFLDFIAAT